MVAIFVITIAGLAAYISQGQFLLIYFVFKTLADNLLNHAAGSQTN